MRSKKTQTTSDLECRCEAGEKRDSLDSDFVLGKELSNINNVMKRLYWREYDEDDFYGDDFDDDYFDTLDGLNDEDFDRVVILADENYADYLTGDNITSCNKVERDLMYSELQQNFSKENEEKGLSPCELEGGLKLPKTITTASSSSSSKRKNSTGKANSNRFNRLWTLRRQSTEDMSLSSSSERNSNSHNNKKVDSESACNDATAGGVASEEDDIADNAKRSMAVIEEVSSSQSNEK